MKLKYLFTISLAVILSACTHQNNDVPIQSNGGYDNTDYKNTTITTTDALAVGAVGAVGVATGYALAKQANKPRYSKPKVRVSRYKRK